MWAIAGSRKLASALAASQQPQLVGVECGAQAPASALHVAKIVGDPHREVTFAGGPPLGKDTRQRALRPSEVTAEPLGHPEVPAHVGAQEPVVLAQVSERRLIGSHCSVGITHEPSSVGTQEGNRGGDVGQHAQAPFDRWPVRLVTDGRERARGICQQRVELLGVALDRGHDGSS